MESKRWHYCQALRDYAMDGQEISSEKFLLTAGLPPLERNTAPPIQDFFYPADLWMHLLLGQLFVAVALSTRLDALQTAARNLRSRFSTPGPSMSAG